MTRTSDRSVAAMLAVAAITAPLALAGRPLIARVAGLHELAGMAHPYWQPDHALLLYVAAPAVVVASFVLFLMPGLLLLAAAGRAGRAEEWLVRAFAVSVGLTLAIGTATRLVAGLPLPPGAYPLAWIVTTAVAGLVLAARAGAGRTPPLPFADGQWRRLLAPALCAFVAVALLVPKLFWENFNLDGIEAFEFGRSLGRHWLPYWEIRDGVFGFYHNFVLFAFVNHWFTDLFGPLEAAARVPFVLFLVLLFPLLTLLIELAAAARLDARERAALWFGLALFALVQVYDTNYEPFYADIAEMAATDTLGLLCFLGACWSLWSGRPGWFAAFGLMTYVATPGGLLLLLALGAVSMLDRSPEGRARRPAIVAVLTACFAIGLLYELAYRPAGFDAAINQFSAKNMLRRLFPPTLHRIGRFAALVFPSGILPALALLAVRRLDRYALMMAGVTIVYFGVIYVQPWTSLHQFTPVMVTPLVVFWRLYGRVSDRARHLLMPALLAGTAVSIVLSAPPHFRINLGVRELGRATAWRVGDYEARYREAAATAAPSLEALLPSGYRMLYPDQPWGTDGYAWLHYATRPKPADAVVNYIVQPSDSAAPPGFSRLQERDSVSVWVRDLEALERERARDFPRVAASPLYEPMLRESYAFFRRFMEEYRGN